MKIICLLLLIRLVIAFIERGNYKKYVDKLDDGIKETINLKEKIRPLHPDWDIDKIIFNSAIVFRIIRICWIVLLMRLVPDCRLAAALTLFINIYYGIIDTWLMQQSGNIINYFDLAKNKKMYTADVISAISMMLFYLSVLFS